MTSRDDESYPSTPRQLSEWLRGEGTDRLSRNANKWLGLVEYASHLACYAEALGEREAFRSIALRSISIGEERGVFTGHEALFREITVRLGYMLNVVEDMDTRRSESTEMAKLFFDSPWNDMRFVVDNVDEWQHRPLYVVKRLRETKNLLTPFQSIVGYLNNPQRDAIEKWLEFLSKLP